MKHLPRSQTRNSKLGLVLKRAARDTLATIIWPKGPMLLCSALFISLAMKTAYSGNADLMQSAKLLEHAAAVAIVLICCAFAYSLFATPYRIERDRAEAAEARSSLSGHMGPDQIKHIVAKHYDEAHTFVHFWPSTWVSLTQNVHSICIHSHQEMSVYFSQALEKNSIVVRPMGGTPRIEIVACDDWHVRIRVSLSSDVIKLRIFGNILPVLRNHPNPSPSQSLAMNASPARMPVAITSSM